MAPTYQFELSEEQAEGFRKLGYNPVKLIAELDRRNWIVVPKEDGKKFKAISGYSFNVSPARLAYSPAVEKVGKELGIGLMTKDFRRDSLGREFLGEINWHEAMMIPQFLGVKATNMKEEVDYLHLIYLGSKKEIKVFDVSGKKIDSKLCEKLLMDSIEAQSPSRSNWVDADYKVGKEGLEVHSNHIFDKQGNIISYKSELLNGDTLMENKQIDFIDFITKNHTPQGHISKRVKSGSLYSWFPSSDNNSAARFDESSHVPGLDCNGDPSYWNSNVGVRTAELAKE